LYQIEKMKDYFNKWSYKRGIQLGVGIYFLYGFFDAGNKLFLIFGLMMSFQAIFNVGCFSTKGCTNTSVASKSSDKELPIVKKIKKIK